MKRVFLASGMTAVLASTVRADLVTGFEAPTYNVGTIVGQQGWTDNAPTGGPDALFTVSPLNPKSGTMALGITDGSYIPAGSTNAYSPELVSPNSGTGAASTTTSFDIDISGITQSSVFPPVNTNHSIYLITDPSADLNRLYGVNGINDYVGGIDFEPDGDIQVQTLYTDPIFGNYMSLTDTGVDWTPNVYRTVSVVVNASTNDMKYYYNGALLADTALDTADGYESAVNYVVFADDSIVNPTELESIDNLSVTTVPEPASLAALGLASVALVGRRRNGR